MPEDQSRQIPLRPNSEPRKQSEVAEAQHQSEEQHRLILEGALDYAIFTIDQQGQIRTWSPGAEAVFGWSAKEAVGQKFAMTFTPEDRAEGVPEKELAEAEKTGQAPDVRWHLRKDGSRAFLDGWTRLLRRIGTEPPTFLKVGQDMTDRREAEARLRESEERLRQFATHSTHLLWTLDLKTRAVTQLGANPDPRRSPFIKAPATQDEWLDAIHPEDRERIQKSIDEVSLGEVRSEEYRIIRPNHQIRWLRDTFFPILDEQGRVRQLGGILQDVTKVSGSLVYVIGNETSSDDLAEILRDAGYNVRGFASSDSFLEAAAVLAPGCVVCDIRLAGSSGLTIPHEIKSQRRDLPVIVVGEMERDPMIGVKAMKAGAADFVTVPYEAKDILLAVASVAGQMRDADAKDQEEEMAKAQVRALPERELAVLKGLLAGGTNKSIGQELNLSPRTVEIYRSRVMHRLNVNSLPELVLVAAKGGLSATASKARSDGWED
ncbi:PAS domain S-box protein [Microvirga pudoricolor]|uniref:PAS domain S-box protein n=1 Tax=Microvirga pudoricolor TaxID=2778729 RepID=UPI0019508F80|nr:PAS domain S-box protein [Microvirga pudoricolor]MBM6593748.1 PAS domain S-box protein [Microvirga pudoricolor]